VFGAIKNDIQPKVLLFSCSEEVLPSKWGKGLSDKLANKEMYDVKRCIFVCGLSLHC